MTKARKTRVATNGKRLLKQRKVLIVRFYMACGKPMNGPTAGGGSSTTFLRLYPVTYKYKKNNGEEKEETTQLYQLKQLRGAFRHSGMQLMFDKGKETCHTSEKLKDKSGNSLIPDGFHPLGWCDAEIRKQALKRAKKDERGELQDLMKTITNGSESCIIHQIFGRMGNEGLVSVHADPITLLPHKTAKLNVRVQRIQTAFENRNAMSFDGKPIQDFKERYLSGYLTCEVIVTKCQPYQLGFVIQCALGLERLGRGYNAGYSRVEVQDFQLVDRTISRLPKWNKDRFEVTEEIKDVSLQAEVEEALEAFDDYLSQLP
ncbi:MAG: hypothetical protein ACXACI_16425 [Candidatus Hodarchaeales archaeon]|jgi:hypothetical protein